MSEGVPVTAPTVEPDQIDERFTSGEAQVYLIYSPSSDVGDLVRCIVAGLDIEVTDEQDHLKKLEPGVAQVRSMGGQRVASFKMMPLADGVPQSITFVFESEERPFDPIVVVPSEDLTPHDIEPEGDPAADTQPMGGPPSSEDTGPGLTHMAPFTCEQCKVEGDVEIPEGLGPLWLRGDPIPVRCKQCGHEQTVQKDTEHALHDELPLEGPLPSPDEPSVSVSLEEVSGDGNGNGRHHEITEEVPGGSGTPEMAQARASGPLPVRTGSTPLPAPPRVAVAPASDAPPPPPAEALPPALPEELPDPLPEGGAETPLGGVAPSTGPHESDPDAPSAVASAAATIPVPPPPLAMPAPAARVAAVASAPASDMDDEPDSDEGGSEAGRVELIGPHAPAALRRTTDGPRVRPEAAPTEEGGPARTGTPRTGASARAGAPKPGLAPSLGGPPVPAGFESGTAGFPIGPGGKPIIPGMEEDEDAAIAGGPKKTPPPVPTPPPPRVTPVVRRGTPPGAPPPAVRPPVPRTAPPTPPIVSTDDVSAVPSATTAVGLDADSTMDAMKEVGGFWWHVSGVIPGLRRKWYPEIFEKSDTPPAPEPEGDDTLRPVGDTEAEQAFLGGPATRLADDTGWRERHPDPDPDEEETLKHGRWGWFARGIAVLAALLVGAGAVVVVGLVLAGGLTAYVNWDGWLSGKDEQVAVISEGGKAPPALGSAPALPPGSETKVPPKPEPAKPEAPPIEPTPEPEPGPSKEPVAEAPEVEPEPEPPAPIVLPPVEANCTFLLRNGAKMTVRSPPNIAGQYIVDCGGKRYAAEKSVRVARPDGTAFWKFEGQMTELDRDFNPVMP